MKKPFSVPCENCGHEIFPARLMGQRLQKKKTKTERKEHAVAMRKAVGKSLVSSASNGRMGV